MTSDPFNLVASTNSSNPVTFTLRSPTTIATLSGSTSTLAGVSMTIDQIVEEIRSLPHDVVADLVDRVLFESHGGQESALARDWSLESLAAKTKGR
jgi:hypothetical protein